MSESPVVTWCPDVRLYSEIMLYESWSKFFVGEFKRRFGDIKDSASMEIMEVKE